MLRVAVGCVLALGQGLLGQEYEWVAVSGATGGPLSSAVLVDDVAGGAVVAFGGASLEFPCSLLGLAGVWRFSGGVWTQASSVGPVARRLHAMASDSARGRIVMFGGLDSSGGQLQDTWEWNGVQWIPFPFAVPPGARSGHAMAFDSTRAQTLMHGGDASGIQSSETWAWNGSAWSMIAANGPTRMVALAFHAGMNASVAVGNRATWLWNGQSWSSAGLAPDCLGLLWDPVRQSVLLVGDPGAAGATSVWRWDVGASAWLAVPMRASGLWPSGAVAAAYDRSSGKPVLRARQSGQCAGGGLGGVGSVYPVFLLQQYVPPRVVSSAVSTGSGCGTPPLTLAQDSVLRPIIGASAALDVSNAPLAFAYLAIGTGTDMLNTYTLPLSLGSLGFTGCVLRQNMDYEGAYPTVATGATSTRATIPIPNDPVLLRQSIHFQAWAFAPGVNPAGITVSNMISWFVGEV